MTKKKLTYHKQDEEEIIEKKPRHFMDVIDEIHALEDEEPKDKRKIKAHQEWKDKMNKLIEEVNALCGEKKFIKIK